MEVPGKGQGVLDVDVQGPAACGIRLHPDVDVIVVMVIVIMERMVLLHQLYLKNQN